MRALICVFLLLAFSPANALFLAGQTEQGGEISILCEGERQVFLSSPSGELRAISLDSDFQAKFSPQSFGPHTFQCGNETKTVAVLLPPQTDSEAYSSGENFFIVAGAAIVFLTMLLIAAKFFLKPHTIFSKSVGNGRVRLFLRAGEDLQMIKISDPQGGEDGAPINLFIPHLPALASWNWEYECNNGEPLPAARLSAKCANGAISILSDVGGCSASNHKMAENNKHENRKLAKYHG